MKKTFTTFVPTTLILDEAEISQQKELGPSLKRLWIRLSQGLNRMALVINSKINSFFVQQEVESGALYFNDPSSTSSVTGKVQLRPGYRVAINCGALPNSTTKNIPHNITWTGSFMGVSLDGCATDKVTKKVMPLQGNITLTSDSTNIIITTSSNLSSYTHTLVVLEFLKI